MAVNPFYYGSIEFQNRKKRINLMMRHSLFISLTLLLLGSGCTSSNPFVTNQARTWDETDLPTTKRTQQVFLIGNVELLSHDTPAPTLDLLKSQLNAAGKNSTVVFLGDNLYPAGLPDSAHADRLNAEKRLLRTLETVADFKGEVVFLPGNRDWNNSAWGGLAALRRQECRLWGGGGVR